MTEIPRGSQGVVHMLGQVDINLGHTNTHLPVLDIFWTGRAGFSVDECSRDNGSYARGPWRDAALDVGFACWAKSRWFIKFFNAHQLKWMKIKREQETNYK